MIDIILKDLDSYLGRVFEEVAKQFLLRLNREGSLPFKFTKVGRWWHRQEEIDLVALNEREGVIRRSQVERSQKEGRKKDFKQA